MILTNPVQPRALSEEGLGRMRRALLRNSRYSGKIQNFGVRSVLVKEDLSGVAQNASHEPRDSVCQVLSQDPSEMRGRLKHSPIVCLGVPIGSQDLKAIPFQ